jgi:hypothetical protein
MGKRKVAYTVLVGKCGGIRPLGRTRRRWEDNIKMDHQEVGCGAWTGSIWLRIGTVAETCAYGNELSGFHKMLEIF